jgi:RND family efflux transporter MFP subunit
MALRRNTLVSVITRTVVGLGLLALALAIFILLVRSRPRPELTSAAGDGPTVLVMQAQPVPVQRRWSGFGTAQAMDTADVPARVGATVVQIPDEVEAGTAVEAGELLAQLDDTDFAQELEMSSQLIADLQAQLERLEIEAESWRERWELTKEEIELARAEYDRVRSAQEQNVAKQREVDQARTAMITAIRNEVAAREQLDALPTRRTGLQALKLRQEAAGRLARQNVQRCRITSPLTGILQSVDVEVGENLAVGQRVARVVSVQRIEVPLRLPSSARVDVSIGNDVELRSAGGVERRWSASVTRIAPEDDGSTRTVTVFVELNRDEQDGPPLAPGMFVEATVASAVQADRWVVPRRAVSDRTIRVVREGQIASRQVEVDFHLERSFPQLGVPDRQWVVLRTDLRSGELVVLDASRALPEGAAVRPITTDGKVMAWSADGAETVR